MRYYNISKIYKFLLLPTVLLSITGIYFNAFSKEIYVKNLSLLPTDITASVKKRLDIDGKPCGLVKVMIVDSCVTFSGNIIGDIPNMVNEFWIYLKEGSGELSISVPDSKPIYIKFKEYGIDSILSKHTYKLSLGFKEFQSDENIDPITKFEQYKKLANEGDIASLVSLGRCFLYGIGTYENQREAFHCFEKAAAKGNEEAIFMLGECYFYGYGTSKSQNNAFKMYMKSAKKGYKPAILAVAKCYETGCGTKIKKTEAQKYYKKANSM